MPLITILGAVAALLAVVLLVVGEPSYAVAPGILLLIFIGAGAFDSLVARQKLERHHGDVHAVEDDARDAFPTMVSDEEAPLGASGESHTDLDPHDLPPGHPSREAVEEAAKRER